jgi:hypothetical protein
MWNDTYEGRQVLTEISKNLIVNIAPEELEIADELLEEYFDNPPQEHANEVPLGFGVEIMVAATPVVAMALQAVFNFLAAEVIQSAKAEGAAFIARKVKAYFVRSNEKPELALSAEQLQKIMLLARKELSRGGMSPKKAEDAALRIVGKLVVAGGRSPA